MPSATLTVNTTGFDSPAARSKACARGPSMSASRESFVRASNRASVTVPASRPVDVLLSFTGIRTTSPSRRNRGTTGSTMRSFADTHASAITPLRRLASWASPLNCQVVSVSGSVNSIVSVPSLSEDSVGRKNAVSTRFFRGGGAAAGVAAGGSPAPPDCLACSDSARVSPSPRLVPEALDCRPMPWKSAAASAGAAATAIGIAAASRSAIPLSIRRPPNAPAQPPRMGEPKGSRSTRKDISGTSV